MRLESILKLRRHWRAIDIILCEEIEFMESEADNKRRQNPPLQPDEKKESSCANS